MLILSRKAGEKLVIDESIEVTVVEIRGDKVRLGIAAPRDVLIRRQDLHKLLPIPDESPAPSHSTEPAQS